MGVSFKVSNKGTRFRPKPKPTILPQHEEEAQIDNNIQTFIVLPKPSDDVTENNKDEAEISDADISFIINLFPHGYSIRNPSENRVNQAVQGDPKLLLPYDRTSESLFSAIERGLLPADFLDDIPCKFINGAVACAVRDYRKCGIEAGINGTSTTDSLSPITSKIRLKMSLENVVKDLPLISNSSWTYGDLMEAEARILKVLHPKLDLDPSPNVDKLCKPPTSTNLNLNIRELRRKRLRQMSGCDNLVHVKKVCMDRGQENSNPGPMVQPPDLVNQTIQNTVPASPSLSYHVGNPRLMQDHGLGAVQDMMNSYTDNRHSNLGKRENQDGQLSPLTGLPAKRARSNSMGLNGSQQPHMDVFDSLMQQQRHQSVGRGVQLPLPTSTGIQKYPFEGSFNQDPFTMGQPGIRYNLKQEPVDFEQHQRLTQQFSRSNFPPTPWNNNNNNNDRKEEQFQRRKSAQSPRVSSGALPQSPLPSKSGEFPSGPAPLGSFQRDKSAVTSVLAVGGPGSLTSNAQMATRRTNGNIGAPLNATSSLAGKEFDKSMLDKMSKIEMLTLRYKLNMKKIKVDEYRDTTTFSTQQLNHFLFNDHNNENPKDEDCKTPLSKSLVGGNMNVCKARILDIMPTERVLQGNSLLVVPTIRRMILSEKQDDGTVAMLYGELDDYDYSAVEEYLPTLPNTHVADLLADQFCTLISREGYRVEGDYIHPKSTNIKNNNAPAISPNAEIPESVSGQPSNEIAKPSDTLPSNNDNGLVNSSGARMHPPANSQPLQVSQYTMQPDSQPSFQQNQQVGHMLQRSSAMMHTSSPLPHLNVTGQNSNIQQVGHMLNKATPQQLQMLQQQQPQPLQMQRKMMTGFGSVGIGANTGNNMAGLQGMGGIRGISPPITGAISGNNMGQSPISVSQAANFSNIISQQLRSGMISPAQAAIMTTRLRMSQNRNILSGSGGQSGNITGLLGANRQVHPGPSNYSMQGPAMNRANTINPMQRTAMAPPKMLSGMNQQQQQQESTSPLQAILSPPQQVGSPPMGLPQQQQASPQQMSPQLSSGTMQPPMSAGNQEANGPASPQLSSQTMGSVGSMVNSPMDMQGVNQSS